MNIRDIRIENFDYPLPDERIARHPLAQRDRCLLLFKDSDGALSTRSFHELPGLLPAGSMLVYNNTRVINARLRFRKGEAADGALIEIFCLEPVEPADYACNFASVSGCSWTCFVGNSKRWKSGELLMPLSIDGHDFTLRATRVSREGNTSVVRFDWDDREITFSRIISAVGEIPIPPYLNRGTEESDSTDYQTVFSHIDGSVAAPTAGLHFTPEVLEAIDAVGIARRELTLHVGAGTFQPVKSDTIGEHDMHSEFIAVDRSLIGELAAIERRIIAVGTTSVRTLESLYHLGCRLAAGLPADVLPQWYPYDPSHPDLPVAEAMRAILSHLDTTGENTFVASTRLMIAPGYRYRVVKGMVTNFHQPKSTLLLLVSAFLASDPANPDWRAIYDYALADSRYRFLSYGDACLFL
ncbi:S-adenosylmethionine:tRNA ribosyltransferase-isomerase [Duncaniella muris]|uniref:S-adenosylmethionine tRNA ribosyltransferase n=1 Tax=Duncaniella muris TaxID=2094150 RepID=A0A2V1IP05_9BACT|nr:S-adenosylmethionine:tRNA ribosyltransferase-isomerase [Duncaniella muris]PWB01287.1 S-adenosylmethionine tRNA ribosyltransferase [Duncaniella muris]